MEKYFNDSIIGNSSILVSLNKKGDILRFFAPQIDYMQHISEHKIAIILNSNIYWLDDENIFNHEQYYEENTNILCTRIYSDKLELLQKDYVDINIDVMVRKYVVIKNIDNIENIRLVVYSKQNRNEDRFVSGWYNEELDALLQYSKDSYFVTFSKNMICDFQINNSLSSLEKLNFNKKEYIGLSNDSVCVYSFNDSELQNELVIYFGFRDSMYLAKKMIETIRTINENVMYKDTKEFWNNIVSKVKKYNFVNKPEEMIYIRSILLLLLYTNDKTGGMIASCEIDEKIEKCGRYAYCWPRDAYFSIEAFNALRIK